LKAYEELNAFKLFILDVGLLGAMVDLMCAPCDEHRVMKEYKGSMTEQYVVQQLKAQRIHRSIIGHLPNPRRKLILYSNTAPPSGHWK
jgi:hypothetical protein